MITGVYTPTKGTVVYTDKNGKECDITGMVHGLISLMTRVEDSNVIWRADYETLQRVQLKAKDILAKGSIFTSIGREEIQKFDNDCVEHSISPGGAADLLSITIALFLLKNA